mmetsp:Transcript_900/g.2008  ORF Transcript_900/g.2008 Transcript_900/m.2008 type:complete len:229 (+) Transcript_900:68-754(+)|eukprot:CAMPEP_0113466762 /NCGR_PEP_ID=MMETSP0014_2-20120614/14448_1 /TAXON_ID=2857 /ORGANISM="Nitzschia sp." /LENGTH=228 /DNA_ID=CAMNT_0000359013 /DNA_START=28 /DNA_END=714 /DNA_ORIENTATION=- /assembly_acc=CAM_ASM_000159
MVYYYNSITTHDDPSTPLHHEQPYMIYMGKDKYENEDLIKYGHPEDVWFHVDDLSSAHVYLRMKPGMTLDAIPEPLLVECAALVKANSIAGCKKSDVYVVYTRWKNLKKTASMVDGQVGFHRPENVRRLKVEKHNSLVRQIEKSKKERNDIDLYEEQQRRLQEIQRQKKNEFLRLKKVKEKQKLAAQQQKHERSYDRLYEDPSQMTSTSEQQATADSTAAEEYEDDFF